jgi:hypothetical protein
MQWHIRQAESKTQNCQARNHPPQARRPEHNVSVVAPAASKHEPNKVTTSRKHAAITDRPRHKHKNASSNNHSASAKAKWGKKHVLIGNADTCMKKLAAEDLALYLNPVPGQARVLEWSLHQEDDMMRHFSNAVVTE